MCQVCGLWKTLQDGTPHRLYEGWQLLATYIRQRNIECTPLRKLTGTRMIQPVVGSVPLIHITHTSIPRAPSNAQILSNSCSNLVHLTIGLVCRLIVFALRLPYGAEMYESGWRLNLLNCSDSISGPVGFGLVGWVVQLACEAAFGLKF